MIEKLKTETIESANSLQIGALKRSTELFLQEKIESFVDESFMSLGVRGKYLDKENFSLNFGFLYYVTNLNFIYLMIS